MFDRLFCPWKTVHFMIEKLYGALISLFLSSRQFPKCSIKAILPGRFPAIALQCKGETWKQMLSMTIFPSHPRNVQEWKNELITRLYVSHYFAEENRIIAISPVKTQPRGEIDCTRKIYRLFPSSSGFTDNTKSFCIQFHVCYVFHLLFSGWRGISREIKFIFSFSDSLFLASTIFYSFVVSFVSLHSPFPCSFFPSQIELCFNKNSRGENFSNSFFPH